MYSLANITFTTNVENFSITMESTQKNYNFECKEKTCTYDNISPFDYKIILTAPNYKDITYTWTPSKQFAHQNKDFVKDYKLEEANLLSQENAAEILNKTVESQIEETIAEKIQKLKEKSQVHLIIEKNNNTYTFKKNNSDMSLYKNDNLIWNFEFANKSDIKLEEIIWNNNYLSLIINNTKYLFSIQTGKINKYTLDIPVKYIKSTNTNGLFIFVTDKWSFEYNVYKNIFTYNSYFSDFVYFDKNSLVGVIHQNEAGKRSRFEYDNISDKTLVIQYNPNTKQRNILLETSKNIEKIFKKDWKIYMEDTNKLVFTLSHLEE